MTNQKLSLWGLSWPILCENFLKMMLSTVNIVMLSRFSEHAVTAVSVATQITNLAVVVCSIISTGTSIIISQAVGARKSDTLNNTINLSILFNLGVGVLLSVLLIVFADPLLLLMNQQGAVTPLLAQAKIYLIVVGGFSFAQATFSMLCAVVRNLGYTKLPMVLGLLMNAINLVLNYFVIYNPMGLPGFTQINTVVLGVAVSVVISEVVVVVLLYISIYCQLPLGLRFYIPRPFPVREMTNILKIGIPAAGGSLSYNISQFVGTYIITLIGTQALTGRVYVQNVSFYMMMVGSAIAAAGQIMVGQCVGAREDEEAYRIGLRNLLFAISFDCVITVGLFFFRFPILRLFTTDEAILAMCARIFAVSLVLEPLRCLNMVLGNALQAAGDIRYNVVITTICTWCISVGLGYLAVTYFHADLVVMYWIFALDEGSRGFLFLLRWKSKKWRNKVLL